MKTNKTLLGLTAALIGSLALISTASAADYYLFYGDTVTNTTGSTHTYNLEFDSATPTADAIFSQATPFSISDPTEVTTTFGYTLTDGSKAGTYSVEPKIGNAVIQYSYLGTSGTPLETTDPLINIGTGNAYVSSPTNRTNTAAFFSPTVSFPAAGPYSQLTILVQFILTNNETISLNGSFDVTTVPEPSTWAYMLGGLGMLGLYTLRRRSAGLQS